MSLKDEAKAAEGSLREYLKNTGGEDWFKTVCRYNGELKSNLQLARADVERLTGENTSLRTRTATAEAQSEGVAATIDAYKRQVTDLNKTITELRAAPRREERFTGKRVRLPTTLNLDPTTDGAARRAFRIWPAMPGFGPYPRMIPDDVWALRCINYMDEFGTRGFFEDLLSVLLQTDLTPGREYATSAGSLLNEFDAIDRQQMYSLPPVTVEYVTADAKKPWTAAMVRGMLLNPVYAGVGAREATVSHEMWVKAATQTLGDEGAAQTLVNILYLLRQTFGHIEAGTGKSRKGLFGFLNSRSR